MGKWGWVDDALTTGSKYVTTLGHYGLKVADDLANYGFKTFNDIVAKGIKNSDELMAYIKNSDVGKLAFSNTLKNPPKWLGSIIPPNLTKNISALGIKNLDDLSKFGLQNADDLVKLGVKNADGLVKLGVKNADDLVKIGIKNTDDLVKLGVKNADDLVKLGVKNADDLAKISIKNADDFAKFGMKNIDDLTATLAKSNNFTNVLKKNWKTVLKTGLFTVGGVALFTQVGRDTITKPLAREVANILKEVLGSLWDTLPEEFKQGATFAFLIIIGFMITYLINMIIYGNSKLILLIPLWGFIIWAIVTEWTFSDGLPFSDDNNKTE